MDRKDNPNTDHPTPRPYRVERRFHGERSAEAAVRSLILAHL